MSTDKQNLQGADTTDFGGDDNPYFVTPKIEPEPPARFTVDEWIPLMRFMDLQEWQIDKVADLARWVAQIAGR